MKVKHLIKLLFISTICLTLLSACLSADKQETVDKVLTSYLEEVTLHIICFNEYNEYSDDMERIVNKLNELSKRDLNCSLNFMFMSPTEYLQEYPLRLSPDEKIDLIWTSSWNNFSTYAAQGAFVPLDEYLETINKTLYDAFSLSIWEDSKINGHIYAYPDLRKTYGTSIFAYREDLRQKYNLPQVVDLGSIEAYLEGILLNEPDILPVAESSRNLGMFSGYQYLNNMYNGFGPEKQAYGIGVSYKNRTRLFRTWDTPEFRDYALLMKKWHEMGFWDSKVLHNQVTEALALANGICAATFGIDNLTMFVHMTAYPASIDHPEWEFGYLNYGEISGSIYRRLPIGSGMAIPITSPNPQRAAMFMEKLFLDKEYNQLAYFGEEGIDYEVSDEGMLIQLENRYKPNFLGLFSGYNPDYAIKSESDLMLDQFNSAYEPYTTDDFWSAFVEDYSSYNSERLALQEVFNTYAKPIMVGAVEDVDEAIELLKEKADEAGYDLIFESMKEQWSNYCQINDIK